MVCNCWCITLSDDETIISFDVTALFPSIPVEVAIEAIRTHLRNNNIFEEHISVYTKAIEKCMQYNCFQFRGAFYKNSFGCSMGNSLSPLVAEAFMSKFEEDLHKQGLLPKIWCRYVDDVFAIVKKVDVQGLLNTLNSCFDSVQFTAELPDNNCSLPFLDVLVKQADNKLQFSVYRKPTTTMRYITNDSFCSYQNKVAAFHSMVYRLVRLPLSVADFKAEYEQIIKIADVNGFDKTLVDTLVHKH